MKLTTASWIGDELFQAVCTEFQDRGYGPPLPDVPGGRGAYVLNIACQYRADLSEQEVFEIIAHAGDNRELPYHWQISGIREEGENSPQQKETFFRKEDWFEIDAALQRIAASLRELQRKEKQQEIGERNDYDA